MTKEELMEKIEKEEKWLIHALNDQTDVTSQYSVDIAIDAIKYYVKDYIDSQPKVGHWIAQDIHNCHTNFKCSECGYIHRFMHLYGKPTADYTYCPNCGAKMIEPQESEDKE